MRREARARAPRRLLGERDRPRGGGRRSGDGADASAWWRDGSTSLRILVASLVVLAAAALLGASPDAWERAAEQPVVFAVLLGLTLGLTLVTVELRAGARVSVAGIGLLAIGFTLGPGNALVAGLAVALVHGLRTRATPARTAFNASVLALAAGAATEVFELLEQAGLTHVDRLVPALAARVA